MVVLKVKPGLNMYTLNSTSCQEFVLVTEYHINLRRELAGWNSYLRLRPGKLITSQPFESYILWKSLVKLLKFTFNFGYLNIYRYFFFLTIPCNFCWVQQSCCQLFMWKIFKLNLHFLISLSCEKIQIILYRICYLKFLY